MAKDGVGAGSGLRPDLRHLSPNLPVELDSAAKRANSVVARPANPDSHRTTMKIT